MVETSEDAAGEFAREAMLWEPAEDNKVLCGLCAHGCRISPGKRGICAVRENVDGKLLTLVYGRAIAAHVDPIEKKPLFHFLPGSKAFSIATAGCNFKCSFCQNWSISQAARDDRYQSIPGEELFPGEVVRQAIRSGCRSISYTYTEPTIYFEYAFDTAILAREKGLKNTFVTNGYQSPKTVEKMAGVIDAANVDLKSFSEEFYRKNCSARLDPVLRTIRNMHQAGIMVEVTTLVIPGQNDSERELGGIAEFLASVSADMPWHVSRFHPDYQMIDVGSTPMSSLERALKAGKKAGLKYIYVGNIHSSDYENTHCPKCGNIVIQRSGFSVLSTSLKGDACAKCGEKIKVVLS